MVLSASIDNPAVINIRLRPSPRIYPGPLATVVVSPKYNLRGAGPTHLDLPLTVPPLTTFVPKFRRLNKLRRLDLAPERLGLSRCPTCFGIHSIHTHTPGESKGRRPSPSRSRETNFLNLFLILLNFGTKAGSCCACWFGLDRLLLR